MVRLGVLFKSTFRHTYPHVVGSYDMVYAEWAHWKMCEYICPFFLFGKIREESSHGCLAVPIPLRYFA